MRWSLIKPALVALSLASSALAINSFFHSGPYYAVKEFAINTMAFFSTTSVDLLGFHNLFDLALFSILVVVFVFDIMRGLESSLAFFYPLLFLFFLPELLGFSEIQYFNVLGWGNVLRVERDFGAVLTELMLFMILFSLTLVIQEMDRVHTGYLENGVDGDALAAAEVKEMGVAVFVGGVAFVIAFGIVLVNTGAGAFFTPLSGLVPYRWVVYAGVAVVLLLAGLLIYFRSRTVEVDAPQPTQAEGSTDA